MLNRSQQNEYLLREKTLLFLQSFTSLQITNHDTPKYLFSKPSPPIWFCACTSKQTSYRLSDTPWCLLAWLAQSVEPETFNLRVVGSSRTLGSWEFFLARKQFSSTVLLTYTLRKAHCSWSNRTFRQRFLPLKVSVENWTSRTSSNVLKWLNPFSKRFIYKLYTTRLTR